MKAVVTGIAGFTGRYLAEALKQRGVEVVGLAQHAVDLPNVDRVHAVDITDADAMRDVIARERPDYVAHLAAISFVVHDDVNEIYRTNLMGTRNLLAALAAADTQPRAVLLASSSNVYGNRQEGIMRESLRPDPVNDYSVSKVASELVANLYRDQLPICIVRPFNYTGVGQADTFLIPKIVAHARARARTIRLGNTEVARDFSDVRFVVEAYCRLLESRDAVGRTINVSSGRAYTLAEVLDLVASLTGHRVEVEVDPALIRANEVRKLWGDSSLLDELVGPIDRIPLRDTLQWMLDAE